MIFYSDLKLVKKANSPFQQQCATSVSLVPPPHFWAALRGEAPAESLAGRAARTQPCGSATETRNVSPDLHNRLTASPTLPARHSHARHWFSKERRNRKCSMRGQKSWALMHTESSRSLFVLLFCFLSAFPPPALSCPLYSVVRPYRIDICKDQERGWGTAEHTPADRLPASHHSEL